MKIDILTVGKVKEKFYRDAIDEYVKRMSRYAKLSIIEVADEKTPDKASDKEVDIILKAEADKLNRHLCSDQMQGACIITLEINGKQLSSEELAATIDRLGKSGTSHIVFVIGGSLGLHNSITSKADIHLSFSKMTFPHQLMRVILLEQIYRSYRIISGEPYHK